MRSPKPLARTVGALYLLMAVLGAFAHLYVRASVYALGDASPWAPR